MESRGVSVTMVCPGYVQTRLSVNALHGDGSHHGGMLDYTGLNILGFYNYWSHLFLVAPTV